MIYGNLLQSRCSVREYDVPSQRILKNTLLKIAIPLVLSVFAYSTVSATQVTPSDAVMHNVNVRSAPSSDSHIIAKLLPGEKAELLNTVGGWYEVRLSDGKTGFVSKSWTRILEVPIDVLKTEKGTFSEVSDTIFKKHLTILSDSVMKLRFEIDSLNNYIERLEVEYKKQFPSQKFNIWFLLLLGAVAFVVIIIFFIFRKVRVKAKPGKNGQNEESLSRRSYFSISTPRIAPTQGTICNLHINLINSGDHPASSLQVSFYMIDTSVTNATIYREYEFSTTNPIASQKDITFCEENIDFSNECTPKFVCIAIEYFDHTIRRRYQQEFTFKWKGVQKGQVREELEHVDKEISELVWVKVRELRYLQFKNRGRQRIER